MQVIVSQVFLNISMQMKEDKAKVTSPLCSDLVSNGFMSDGGLVCLQG